MRVGYLLTGGGGDVTVLRPGLIVPWTVVVTFTVVDGRGAPPPIAGIGVVTVRGSVVAGNVVNDNAAFFWYVGVTMSLSAGASEPPHAAKLASTRVEAKMARRFDEIIGSP